MKKLFWGFCFIYLNFTLNLNQFSLNVLPDFVGYILLLKGIRELEEESRLFRGVRPFAVGMAVYTAILWVGALLGAAANDGMIARLLSLVGTIVSLYISWLLIRGVAEMEEKRAADLNGERLLTLWKTLAAIRVVTQMLELMLNLVNMSILAGFAVVLLIVGLIVIIMYLIAWKKAADAWDALPPRVSEFEIK